VEAWLLFSLAAAFLQNLRNSLQKSINSVLSTFGAAYTRFVFGLPLAFLYWIILRSFDTQQSTIEVLPAVVEEVGDEVEIYMDSGIRRGTDVLKALALGARAVGVGRPLFWGLAIDGEAGVRE